MPRQRRSDCLELRALILEEQDSIKCYQGSARTDRNALARVSTDSDPIKTAVDSPAPRFRTDPADANDGVESALANRAHAVLAPKDTVFVRIKRMRPVIDQGSHHC